MSSLELTSQPASEGAAEGPLVTPRAALYRPVLDSLEETFGSRLKAVVLFGSQARGDATGTSDHDLLVVAEDLPTQPLARQRTIRMTLLPVLHRLPGAINFTAKTPAEVAANLTPLLVDVCADGICLLGADYFEPLRRAALAALRQSGMHRPALGARWRWRLPDMPRGNWELTWEGYRERA
ncbi:MAG: hypothetical protein AUJ96_27030 [Armatimonadetes bacterium CG2_30_66_41]|nr:nucleotidyltransferase domain-containing protein [Armatimonadota bacterium]OIO95296.1 MAG: hypothetical protein AUJ96_27030 [Armatimonadetes bacterium CG2_30_66_41]NCO89747.1 nucleotidyltransferase domain-containing protein [Armatimonadota bacterium]NCP28442.1 nucleotidyltransferase domain-containing protein [Armatimonadota bacterium]NCQ25901.1 nucleotidyltransferase domain-containing protein [Armatimonadota bacterium]